MKKENMSLSYIQRGDVGEMSYVQGQWTKTTVVSTIAHKQKNPGSILLCEDNIFHLCLCFTKLKKKGNFKVIVKVSQGYITSMTAPHVALKWV